MTDVLPVVAVTYSPGPHLERFLASLSLATERPVSVLLADNGSTDGTPQAAVQRYPKRAAAAHRGQPRVRNRGESDDRPAR